MKCRLKNNLILILFSLLPFFLQAQGEWNKWYFGIYAPLDFNSGVPIALTNSAMWGGPLQGMSPVFCRFRSGDQPDVGE
jgi:hypothetical protein